MREHFEDLVSISGIGISQVGRRLQRDPWTLTAEAALAAIAWLEALGLCARGGAAKLVEGGSRISRHGELPINTGGGHCRRLACMAISSSTRPASSSAVKRANVR